MSSHAALATTAAVTTSRPLLPCAVTYNSRNAASNPEASRASVKAQHRTSMGLQLPRSRGEAGTSPRLTGPDATIGPTCAVSALAGILVQQAHHHICCKLCRSEHDVAQRCPIHSKLQGWRWVPARCVPSRASYRSQRWQWTEERHDAVSSRARAWRELMELAHVDVGGIEERSVWPPDCRL